MREAMRADEKVIVMGLDIRWGGSFGQFRGLYDEFGDRVIDKRIQPLKGEVAEGYYTIPLGQAAVRREGKDVTIVAYSGMAINGAQACETLATEHGIDAELIDLRTIVPLDFEAIARSVAKTRRAVICHEGWVSGGVGAEI